MTIQGVSARTTTVHATGSRVLAVSAGSVKIAHATLRGGSTAGDGGVLVNAGTLELDHVRVTGGAAADGGGIANQGTLTLDHSLVDANQATAAGGGVFNTGTLTARDSTVALNTAAGIGGISGGGATLDRVTVARNGGGGVGGDAIRVTGSLLAANEIAPGTPKDCFAGITTGGGNVASSFSCLLGMQDKVLADPKLGLALVNAGGETDVLRLAPDSEAQDFSGACASTDQRGLLRPQGGACDPGAYEIEAVQLTGPQGPTASHDVEFSFTAAPGSDFRCTLDGEAGPCTSPQDLQLDDGPHTFSVQAVSGDEPLSDVVERSLTIDTVAPEITFTPEPPALTNQSSIAFTFSAGEEVAFTCHLDAVAFAPCTSGHLYEDLADGDHTFTLRAADAAGNATVAVRRFTVDTVKPDAPVVEHPAEGSLATSSPVVFDGTVAEPGGAVTIRENGVLRGRVNSLDGVWSTPIAASDGTHTYAITVDDAAGNTSAPVLRTVRVDADAPAAPRIVSPAEASAQRSTTVTLAGTTEPGASVAVLEGADARGAATADADGDWALAIAGVAEGVHAYTATATDTAGHVGAASEPRSVRVDLTPPPAPVVSGGPDAFELSSPEADAVLACRLDGPAGPGEFAACASPLSFPGLPAGEYLLVVRATDAAGNASTTERRFAVAAALPAPAPAATPRPVATPAPTPSFRQTVVLRPSTGRTLIKRPGATAFEELRSKTTVPLGATVDARTGLVVITAAPAGGASPQSAEFTGGVFTIAQPDGATELALSGTLRCGTTRRLWGDGAGAFRIRGRFGTATGRGAKWLVQDSCRTTVVRVTRGVVAVRDDRTRKTLLVRAGRRYETRPKR